MKRLAMTVALVVAVCVPSLAGEVPTGGKTEPPPPTTTQTTSTSTTNSIAASIILIIVSLTR